MDLCDCVNKFESLFYNGRPCYPAPMALLVASPYGALPGYGEYGFEAWAGRIIVSDYTGICFEIKFSGRHRGHFCDDVLYTHAMLRHLINCRLLLLLLLLLYRHLHLQRVRRCLLICDRWLILGSETISISPCLNH